MEITNKLNMPPAFVEAVTKEFEYNEKRFRVTDLSKGIRECILFRRHHNGVTIDASDMVWAVFGSAVHNVLSSTKELPDELREQEVRIGLGGGILVGHFDSLDTVTLELTDYKTASVYKVIYKDWEDAVSQITTYAMMLDVIYGIPVRNGRVLAFLKDHSKSKARYDRNYPQSATHEHKFTITESDIIKKFEEVTERMEALIACEGLADNDLPLCTEKERWSEPTKYAVMKPGRKTAVKLCDTYEEAQAYIRHQGVPAGYVDTRAGTDKKCPDYCMAKEFCSYWQERYSNNIGGETDGE